MYPVNALRGPGEQPALGWAPGIDLCLGRRAQSAGVGMMGTKWGRWMDGCRILRDGGMAGRREYSSEGIAKPQPASAELALGSY